MLKPFTLNAAHLAALASGHGGPAAVDELRRIRLSRTLLLLKVIVERYPSVRPAYAVLSEAQRHDRRGCELLLSEPMVGAWAAQTVRAIRGGTGPVGPHLEHLAGIAAVAARRCGVDTDLVPAARDGWVVYPTAGRTPAATDGSWQPVHRLSTAFPVVLDDVDPYRGGHHAPPADRLDDSAVGAWRAVFGDAWELLTRRLPDRAEEIAAGLRCVVPLVPDSPHAAQSATVGDAFGAFGATMPPSAVDFAVSMVHEFQHNKLEALLTLHPLTVPGPERYFAPWRVDPRPIGGLLHGVYAFLAVADAWHRLRAEPDLESTATAEFAAARAQLDVTLNTVQASGALTPEGTLFTAGMRRSLDTLLTVPLPAGVVRDAHRALNRTRQEWLRRHA